MPWHFLFETLAYVIAFRVYVRARDTGGDFLDTHTRWDIVVAAIAGAAIGSRILFWFEDPARTAASWTNVAYLISGKTIVGALAGGTLCVEFVKWRNGLQRRTGDLFAVPIAVGIAIGRLGCLFAGKQDDTFGVPATLPWAIDLGDGVRRHPVQIYEMLAMVALVFLLARIREPGYAEGDRYRVFVFAYFSWRLAVDFLKPGVRFHGLTILQWVCAAEVLWYAQDMWRIMLRHALLRRAVAHG